MDGAWAGVAERPADCSNQARGRLDMRWHDTEQGTRLASVHQTAPYRLLKPRVEPDEPPIAVAANVSGGVVGGDTLDLAATVGPNASLSVIGQAAEKIYRSAGPTARLTNRISVGKAGALDWMPQGTILFDGARMVRHTRIDLSADASLLYGEILIFGRRGMGERVTAGKIADALDVSIEGGRIFADRFRLTHAMTGLVNRFALDDAAAAGLAVIHAPKSDLIDAVRGRLLLNAGVRCGVTKRGPLLVVRWLGADAARLRASVGEFWCWARAEICGFPARLPSVWVI